MRFRFRARHEDHLFDVTAICRIGTTSQIEACPAQGDISMRARSMTSRRVDVVERPALFFAL